MYRAILVDDEKPAIDLLTLLLEENGQIGVIGSFTRAADILAEIRHLKPNVVFLDIEMPEISGLELAAKIIEIESNVEIIFVTAYDRYALEAFRANAIDYILKPASADDITEVIKRLNKIRHPKKTYQMPTHKARIHCFGTLSVYGAECGEALKWRTAKTEELFAFMLQNLNTGVPKWKITQALWPEYDEEKKTDVNLYTTVYKVKKHCLMQILGFLLLFKTEHIKWSYQRQL